MGNKCDLDARREVSKEEGDALAKKHNIRHFEASAKNNINVDEAFMSVAQSILSHDSSAAVGASSVKIAVTGSEKAGGCCK